LIEKLSSNTAVQSTIKNQQSKMPALTIRPAKTISGSLRLPGDKSISHRYAMLGAVANGTTHLENFSTGADCASTLACLETLGVRCERDGSTVTIDGRGPQLKAPTSPLNCGNSGSTMRMLSGILAGQLFTSEFIGDASLSRRPMARIIDPLTAMGASIHAQDGQRPPLRITGARLKAIDYQMPIASAQVKTAVLFAGLFADGETSVTEPMRTRDHTEIALRAFGGTTRVEANRIQIRGREELHAIEATIPGDLSSAAFFLCATALFPGSRLVITELLMNPTRARLLEVLISMGLGITVVDMAEQHGELRGTVQVEGRTLEGGTIAGAETAALIDELPVLAAIAPYTKNGIEIRDARELRLKESDRIASVAANLRAMAAQVNEREDGLHVPGSQKLHGAEIDSFDDHRIAMAFAIAALGAEGETRIQRAESAAISYPAFFETLESVVQF
jgi:3-phosphoshikimate 1-carboxyvinyltransferase